MLTLSEKGDNAGVDMLVGDICKAAFLTMLVVALISAQTAPIIRKLASSLPR